MKIKQLKLGPMDNFSYIVWDESLNEAAVIDPAWQPGAIEEFLLHEKLALKLLLLTHAHPDHANAALYFLQKDKDLALTMHKEDAFLLDDAVSAGGGSAGLFGGKPLKLLNGEEELALGRGKIKVIHTPGHTPGSVSYAADGAVFTGDTLFVGECGRVDLPGSDPKALRQSLLKLAALPDNAVVWPGHAYNGNTSTIGVQKEYNIYMKLAAKSEAEFLKAAV
ncbi:MAG: MBL fold metallo-hydrolase [Elusimicrobia bacterium]|nr:MBL fold metallo-hydrolase [Elusimicrobiota bacterium]